MEAGTLVELYETAVKSVTAEVQDYWLNAAFLTGHQWVYVNKASGRLENYEGDPERVQATVNRIWPATRTTTSKMLQRSLVFEVLPSEPDDATMRGAATAEAILHQHHLDHRWEMLRERNAFATWLGGTAAIAVDWDASAGTEISDGVYTGDTVETPLSIAEFVVEPGAKEPVTARYWFKAQALPPAQVKSTYGLKDKPPADATNGLSPLQANVLNESHGSGNKNPDLTRVLTYYERPNKNNPKGTVAVVVNGKFVQEPKPWPFPFTDRLNFAVTYETSRETKWAGETVVTMARPIQVLYNLAQSNVAEHMKNAGSARMAVPQSTMDIIETISDVPGEMLVFPDGTEKPGYIDPPQMPNWWSEWPMKLEAVMDDLLGVHDISRGSAPVNIESGYGLSILAEHDSTPIGRMVKSQAEAFGQVATMVLEILADNVKETRKAMIRTEGQAPETVTWSGKDLQGQTLAVVPTDAILPRSRAAMQAMAEKMVQMGLVQDLETFSALVELPEQRHLLDRARPDVAKARRENGRMALGIVELPADFDEHDVHIAEHNVFRKSARYERMTPEQREIIDTHIAAHQTMASELAGKARKGAAIDPMLAAVPTGDSRPSLMPEQLPPEALALDAPGADNPFVDPESEQLAELADIAAQIGD